MSTRYSNAPIKEGGYTGYGWAGVKNTEARYISVTEIGKELRKTLKEKYPDCVFSVVGEKYSGGQSLNISLMSAPFDVFVEVDEHTADKKYDQVNHYHLKDSKRYTEKAKEILTDVRNLTNSYNFDDSDGMIDYFNTNFYLHLSVGKWDKPFNKV